jgi:hypothetical protein
MLRSDILCDAQAAHVYILGDFGLVRELEQLALALAD